MSQEERTLNQSDEQARRLVDIAITLTTSPGPVSSTRIRELHYPGSNWDSFRRMFSRDRSRLALCGVIVVRTNQPPDEPLWRIDERDSFVTGDTLDPEEALILDVACSQLASDGSFPLADDLRIALAKIDRSFDRRTNMELVSYQHGPATATTITLERCALERHAADISYVRADGTSSEHRIAIFGMFSLRGHSYAVGPRLSVDGTVVDGSIRTYRFDRFASVRELKRITYTIPFDFDVRDYVLLPFQLGESLYYAHFAGPTSLLQSVIHSSNSSSSLVHREGTLVLEASVSSEGDAASWSIAQGLVPLDPPSLVTTWKSILRRTLERRYQA